MTNLSRNTQIPEINIFLLSHTFITTHFIGGRTRQCYRIMASLCEFWLNVTLILSGMLF